MRILRTGLLTVAGGLLIAFVLFSLTHPRNDLFCCGVNTFVTDQGGINALTGEVRPTIVTSYALDGSGRVTVGEYPDNWKQIRVIPLPVGFVVGSLLTLTVITLARRRTATPRPAASPV